jgi:hypothetical protein
VFGEEVGVSDTLRWRRHLYEVKNRMMEHEEDVAKVSTEVSIYIYRHTHTHRHCADAFA